MRLEVAGDSTADYLRESGVALEEKGRECFIEVATVEDLVKIASIMTFGIIIGENPYELGTYWIAEWDKYPNG